MVWFPSMLMFALVGCGASGEILVDSSFQEENQVVSFGPWELKAGKEVRVTLTPKAVGTCQEFQFVMADPSGSNEEHGRIGVTQNATTSIAPYPVKATGLYGVSVRLFKDQQPCSDAMSSAVYHLKVVSK
jgi:hypothetical protein